MTTISAALAIGYENLADGITPTVPSSQTGYGADKLGDPRIVSEKHRGAAAALTNFTYDLDLASNKQPELFALLGTNYSDGATFQVTADDTAGFVSPTYGETSSANVFDVTHAPLLVDTPAHGRHLIHLVDTITASRYVRIKVTDTGNADNYLQAGVYWVGKVWQPAVNVSQWQARDVLMGEPGLERLVREHVFTFQYLTEAECRQLVSLARALKRVGRVVLIPRALSPASWIQHAIYATIADAITVVPFVPDFTAWQCQLTFPEVLD